MASQEIVITASGHGLRETPVSAQVDVPTGCRSVELVDSATGARVPAQLERCGSGASITWIERTIATPAFHSICDSGPGSSITSSIVYLYGGRPPVASITNVARHLPPSGVKVKSLNSCSKSSGPGTGVWVGVGVRVGGRGV